MVQTNILSTQTLNHCVPQ